MNPLISIIIPCFNDGEYVQKAVDYAIRQTYSNKEIIVIDDGSDLRTKSVLKSIEPKIDRLIVQSNKGVGVARNIGIEKAMGEFILVWDADDYFESEFCEKAIRIISKMPNVKVVSCWARWFKTEKDHMIFKPIGGGFNDYLLRNVALGSSLFRKSDWLLAGKYDEKLSGFEDWEYYIRLHENGGITYIIKEVLFNYRKKNNSRNINANKNKTELLKYIYFKHEKHYKNDFQNLIEFLLNQIDLERNTSLKRENSLNYRIGEFMLAPFRFIKSVLGKKYGRCLNHNGNL